MDEFNNNNNEHNNNDTHNNNNNNNNNNTDKVVGVLGGMGPNATVDFLQLVIRHTVPYAQHDQDHVRMVVHHNPRIPNRQRAILLHKKNIRSNNNNNNITCNKSMSLHGPNNNNDENNNNDNNTDDENNNNNNNENNDDIIGRMLMDMVRCLVRHDGVDFIVMPCNLGHVWEKDIVKAAILQTCTQTVQHTSCCNLDNDHNKDCHCDNDNDNADNNNDDDDNNNTTTVVPFISMIDVTVEAAIAKCRTIGIDDDDASESHDKRTRKIGLLTTPGCFHAGLYQTAFDRALANRRNHHRNRHNDDDQQQQQQEEEDDDDDDDIVLILQSEEELDRTMELVYRIKCGDTSSSVVVDGMIRLTRALVDRGAQVVIAACTEIPLVLKNSTSSSSSSSIWNDNNDDGNTINVPLISSTEELAKRTVALALGHDI